MEDQVTFGDANDAENAFFIEEPSNAADSLRRRRGPGLLRFAVVGFGLSCTLGLVAVVTVGVMGRTDEIRQLQRGFEAQLIASSGNIASPLAAEPTELSDVVPAVELAPEPVAPPADPAVRSAAPAPASAAPSALDLARVEVLSVESEGASRVRVRCGEVSATGTESVRLADFPAGFCTVEVRQFDDTFRVGLGVEEAKSLRCGVEDGVLRCS